MSKQPGRRGPSNSDGPRAATYYAGVNDYQPGYTTTAGPSQNRRGSNLDGFSLNSNPIPPPSNFFIRQNTDFGRVVRYRLVSAWRIRPLAIIFVHLHPELL